MSFEIKKLEGLGRLGILNLGKTYETPTFLNIYKRNEVIKDPIKKTIMSHVSSQPQFHDSVSYPNCNIYPSLQMQGKSLSQLTKIEEFFPKSEEFLTSRNNSFNLVPWDLPEIYIDNGKNYYKRVNELVSKTNIINNSKFMINVPFKSIQVNTLKNLPLLNIEGICLGDITSFLNHPKFLLSYLSSVRKKITPDVLLYAPGVPSSFFPILAYLGVDLFDFTYRSISNNSDIVLEIENSVEEFILALKRTRVALKNGKLRDLVRIYSNSYPPQKTLLRLIDKQIPLDVGCSIYSTGSLYCTDQTDFSRPEVARFRKRVKDRFQLGSHIQGIIFLPCSAKKPYSQSKSHQAFQRVIRRTLKSKRHSIAEIILTSPLGVVPRELEYTYPAAHYDIPVTGEWSGVEKKLLHHDLEAFLNKIPEAIQLIGYVRGTEGEVLANVCRKLNREIFLIDEVESSLISKESLYKFRHLISENLDIEPISKGNKLLEFLRTVADFQFGRDIGKVLIPEKSKLQGHKELGIRIQISGKHLMTFRSTTGLLTLSIEAAKRIFGLTNNVVRFDGEIINGTTIFANAIKEADQEIRINDEVIVVNGDNEIIATGVAYLPGKLLMDMPRGLGVKIRQKVKNNA